VTWIRQLGVGIVHPGHWSAFELEPVQGVGRIGQHLAQKDFALGIQGMNEDVEKLLDFRLELKGVGHRWVLQKSCQQSAVSGQQKTGRAKPRDGSSAYRVALPVIIASEG
jgi:hypothetical protein